MSDSSEVARLCAEANELLFEAFKLSEGVNRTVLSDSVEAVERVIVDALRPASVSDVVAACDAAIVHLAVAYRIVDAATVPYVADMLFDAMSVVDEVRQDVVVKGLK